MLVQLPDGRTVEMSIEEYLNLDDTGMQNLMASKRYGVDIKNPFFKPYNDNKSKRGKEISEDVEFNEEDYIGKDVTDVPSEFKRLDQDFEDDEDD